MVPTLAKCWRFDSEVGCRCSLSTITLAHTQKTVLGLLCLHPHWAEALSDAFVWRLTYVWCLSVAYIGPNSRTERPRKTKIGTEVAHVTRDSDTSFKVKCSTQGQLVADVLNSQRVGIGATWRINTKILSTCRERRHIVAAARPPRACLGSPVVSMVWYTRV